MLWEMVGEDAPPIPRKRIEGTEQQENFWTELREGGGNVVVEARAGSGKSTSCREGMWRLIEHDPDVVIRYCCFNKKVSEEFGAKSPPSVDVGTMHRFGLQALQSSFRCTIEKNKTYMILDDVGGRDLKRYFRKSVSMLVGLAKNHNVDPETDGPVDLYTLLDRFDVQCYGKSDLVVSLAWKCLCNSLEMTSVVDFDDMLWLAVRHQVAFPSVDLLFIDEAQDLNATQHAMAECMAGSGRTIVVGDPYQSIYAFRGADSQSMERLKNSLDATVLPLTVSFRCPRLHVEKVQPIVPDFQAAPDAIEGEWYDDYTNDPCGAARPGDLVLCRSNGPIVASCLKAIARGVPATVRGRAIGDSLLSIVSKINEPTTNRFFQGLDRWKSAEINRLSDRDGTEDLIEQTQDRAACLEAVASSCACPTEIPHAIDRLFSDSDSERMVTFSSVHRAKGSEAETVIYLDVPYPLKRDRTRPPQAWELQQRRNLRYVALTRSLNTMTLSQPVSSPYGGDRTSQESL